MDQDNLLALLARLVVRPSFQRCDEHGINFFDSFYASLAERASVGALFANTDMRKQNGLVRSGIDQLIGLIEDREGARSDLEQLGRRHSRDGLDISPELYSAWVDALMTAVAEFDPLYHRDLDDAWRHVVAPGINIMITAY